MSSQVNQVVPIVEMELGGKKRELLFDFNALIAVEKLTGKNTLSEAFQQPSATVIAALLWAALQHKEKVSMEEVGKMLHFGNLNLVGEIIQKALSMASVPTDALKKNPGEE